MSARALLVLCAAAVSGCALLGKNDPLVVRVFSPEYDRAVPAVPLRSDLQLRLGRVEGEAHLRERMAARRSPRELTFHEDRRWSERPETYLRRALARTLFEERGLVETLSGRGVTLDVELLAFEELEESHQARMQLLLVLRDDRIGLVEETITVDQAVVQGGEDRPRAVVDALSLALRTGVAQVADRVVAELGKQAARAAR